LNTEIGFPLPAIYNEIISTGVKFGNPVEKELAGVAFPINSETLLLRMQGSLTEAEGSIQLTSSLR
jgi:hypothetical protein